MLIIVFLFGVCVARPVAAQLATDSTEKGHPSCWDPENKYTYEECCALRFGVGGNSECWGKDGQTGIVLTPELCCWKAWELPGCWKWDEWKSWIPRFVGWRVSSQDTQDSVLFFLFSILGATNGFYVEFGVNDPDNLGTGSNTALLQRSKWRVIPPQIGDVAIQHLGAMVPVKDRARYYNRRWHGVRFDIENENPAIGLHRETITPASVVSIFQKHKVPVQPDFVSIDIDSCDVWVFLALTKVFRPRVITVEYNWLYSLSDDSAMACDADVPSTGNGDGGLLTGRGASLLSIFYASRHRGYHIVWVTCGLDVHLVREDLVCEGHALSHEDLEMFRGCTGVKPKDYEISPSPEPVQVSMRSWVQSDSGSRESMSRNEL